MEGGSPPVQYDEPEGSRLRGSSVCRDDVSGRAAPDRLAQGNSHESRRNRLTIPIFICVDETSKPVEVFERLYKNRFTLLIS